MAEGPGPLPGGDPEARRRRGAGHQPLQPRRRPGGASRAPGRRGGALRASRGPLHGVRAPQQRHRRLQEGGPERSGSACHPPQDGPDPGPSGIPDRRPPALPHLRRDEAGRGRPGGGVPGAHRVRGAGSRRHRDPHGSRLSAGPARSGGGGGGAVPGGAAPPHPGRPGGGGRERGRDDPGAVARRRAARRRDGAGRRSRGRRPGLRHGRPGRLGNGLLRLRPGRRRGEGRAGAGGGRGRRGIRRHLRRRRRGRGGGRSRGRRRGGGGRARGLRHRVRGRGG